MRHAIPKREPIASELAAFRDAVLGLPNDAVSMREGVRTVQVAEALLESSATGQTVRLDRQPDRTRGRHLAVV